MADEASEASESPEDAVQRFRGAVGLSIGLAVLGYLVYAVWHGLQATTTEITQFRWALYVPVLMLTLVNYTLRYAKWAYLLRALGIDMPHRANAWAYTAGLGMVISPGKAGELVKPWVVREVTGAPMARTIPALITERLTDGIAVAALAAIGVATFYPENTTLIFGTLLALFVLIGALSIEPLAVGLLGILRRLGPLSRLAGPLEESWRAMRTCVAPGPLVATILLSIVAWWAECVGYWLVFMGLDVDASLSVSTFLYAFATLFGAPSPGGLGMADMALVETAVPLIDTLSEPQAIAAALLVRIATLWVGVVLGAFALMRIDRVIRDAQQTRSP